MKNICVILLLISVCMCQEKMISPEMKPSSSNDTQDSVTTIVHNDGSHEDHVQHGTTTPVTAEIPKEVAVEHPSSEMQMGQISQKNNVAQPVSQSSETQMEEPQKVKELGQKPQLETPYRFAKKTADTAVTEAKTKVKIDRSKFGKTLLKSMTGRPYISGYIDTYLENGITYRYEEHYSASTNLYFLPHVYQSYVRTIIDDVCICRWPLVVRYMVFPRVYGFYKNDKILGWLEALYSEFPLDGVVSALSEGLSEDEEQEKQDLLEKLASSNAIKTMVDENLIQQSAKLLEAQDLKEEIHELFDNVLTKYNLITESEQIDKEIALDDLIEDLKSQL